MLATLYNIFTDETGMNQFAFANADLHFRQNGALETNPAYRGRLPYYVLDPIPKGKEIEGWLQQHQDIHTRVNTILGIAGNDLSEVDFANPEQVASWIWLHAQEHVQVSNKLRLP